MKCGLCGRTLKGTDSISRGYGPICIRKIKPPTSKKSVPVAAYNLIDDANYSVPGQMELSDFIEMPENEKENSSD